MDEFDLRNNLVDALIQVVGDTLSYEFVLSELKLLLSRGTVANLSGGNLSLAAQWAHLIAELSEIEAGLISLKRVLHRYLSNKRDWPILSDAIEGYCLCIYKTRSSDGRLSSSIQYERSIQHRQAIEKLCSLASQYHDISAHQLEYALNATLQACHPSVPCSQLYSPVFCEGPINTWSILLDRMDQANQCFDETFLEILQRNLSGFEAESFNEDPIGSLLIMLLKPLLKPNADTYSFRAYYCSPKAASSAEWIKVFDPAADHQIQHGDWRQKLEVLLPKLLREARAMRQSPHEQLLVEIFLPTELIDADIRTLQVSWAPGSPAENLGYSYRIVARSTWRYQTFVECQDETILDPPLLHRWRHLSRVQQKGKGSSFWWHDTIGQPNGPQAQDQPEPKEYFVDLKGLAEFFGMKRLADIHDGVCYQTWKINLMAASPAIALWWPPTSTSQPEHRQSIFTGSGEAVSCATLGLSACDLSNPQPDPFDHPDASDPLKLFYALASAVYRGQFNKDGSGQAFREMVLLVDSHERWPPPLDRSPVSQASPDGSGALDIDADEMLMPR
jgi:hypothetical protein